MTRITLPLVLISAASSASAASTDILPSIYKDGVFRSALNLPAAQIAAGSRGVQLKPDSFGGEWFLTLTGAKLVSGAHLSYSGSGQQMKDNAPAVAKITARLGSKLATECFTISADRMSELRTWLETTIRAGAFADLNTERSFGPMRVQLLAKHHLGGPDSPEGRQDIDVLLSRKGTPAVGSWVNTCKQF